MRFVGNIVNGTYLRVILDEVRRSKSSEVVMAAVAYLTWADDLMNFCVKSNIQLKLFCLFNAEARPSPAPVKRILDRAVSGWELWFTADYYHPKVIWFRGAGVYIGSANLTQNSWARNVEAGIFFDRDEVSRYSLDAQVTTFFATIKPRFRHAIHEDLDAIGQLNRLAHELDSAKQDLNANYHRLVTVIPGSDSPASQGPVNSAQELFVQE